MSGNLAEQIPKLCDPLDLKRCIQALLRVLFRVAPSEAERIWSYKSARRYNLTSSWYEIRRREGTRYMSISPEGGRTQSQRPENVDLKDFVVIDDTGPTPTALVDFLGCLSGKLERKSPEDENYWYALLVRIRTLRLAYIDAPNFYDVLDEIDKAAISGLVKSIEMLQKSSFPKTALADHLLSRTRLGFSRYEMFGTCAGISLFLILLFREADPIDLCKILFPKGDVPHHVDFASVIGSVMKKHKSGLEWIKKTARTMRQFAEQFQRIAGTLDSDVDFYNNIFESSAWAWGGFRVSTILSEIDHEEQSVFEIERNVCDELLATAAASLSTAFEDSLDLRCVRMQRDGVAYLRQHDGDLAADRRADELVDFALLFPPLYRSYLLGQSENLTLRRDPVPGQPQGTPVKWWS